MPKKWKTILCVFVSPKIRLHSTIVAPECHRPLSSAVAVENGPDGKVSTDLLLLKICFLSPQCSTRLWLQEIWKMKRTDPASEAQRLKRRIAQNFSATFFDQMGSQCRSVRLTDSPHQPLQVSSLHSHPPKICKQYKETRNRYIFLYF